MPPILKNIILSLYLTLCVFTTHATNLPPGALIRDTEIEAFFKQILSPLTAAATLDPAHIKLHLVVSKELNAVTSIGGHLSLHTGLILACEDVCELLGVIAHELGHIAGGHISRTIGVDQQIKRNALVTSLFGVATLIATGAPSGVMGAFHFGESLYLNAMLHYSRGQESSADQAAVLILKKAGFPVRGLKSFLIKLQKREHYTPIDPYMQTHPLSKNRILMLEKETLTDTKEINTALQETFKKVQLKLKSFLEKPEVLLRSYREQKGWIKNYVQSIAYYRQGHMKKSLACLQNLLAKEAQDPYLWELYGQVLSEFGQWDQAEHAYAQAKKQGLNSALLNVAHAQTLIFAPHTTPEKLKRALSFLYPALSDASYGWRFIAICYGKLGQMGHMALALAEYALTQDNIRVAQKHARKAQTLVSATSPEGLRVADILQTGTL